MKDFQEQKRLGEQLASGFAAVADIVGDDDIDTKLLREMAVAAEAYISDFSWCQEVLESYFANGVGGIFAVFFFRIHSNFAEMSPWIWIMVGDVPPAYLPLKDCESDAEAFQLYCEGMSMWVELARKGETGTPEQGVPPVNVPATPEWADVLEKRLYGLRQSVGPFFGESLKSSPDLRDR